MWKVSILTIVLCLLFSVNAIAQAPPPTNPYVANVLDYGAVGNCTLVGNTWTGTDNTAAIQAAIDDVSQNHPGGTVLVPDGTYLVSKKAANPGEAITLKSNITFKMTSGATIQLKETNAGSYVILYIRNATNVNVVGGTVSGERHQHLTPGNIPAPPYTDPNCTSANSCYGQWGYGIRVSASSNVYFEEVLAKDCWGDGFIVSDVSTNVNLYRVVADGNRRQGLSIIWVDGMVVKNSIFKNTRGHNPQTGIDLEPDAGKAVNNVQILNNSFINNHFGAIGIYAKNGPVTNVVIDSNTSTGGAMAIRLSFSASNISITNNTLSATDYGFYTYGGVTASTITGNTVTAPTCFYGNFTGNTISPNTCFTGSVLTVYPANLSFGDEATGSTSDELSYLLTGINLTDNVTVTAPAGYEISTTSGSGFGSSKTVTQTGGTVSQTIYVRFTPTAVQVYNGNVTNASPGVATMNVALTGSGTGKATGASDVKKSSSTITIDGSLSECDWANANSSTFINAVQSNNTVKISTLWDSANLYMAYEVTDSQIETPAVSIWSQDAIELYLDAGHEKSTAIDANDYQFIISAANEIGYFQAAVGKTIQKAVTISGPGYIVEMAVPWAQIGIIPAEGTALGALFANDDRDAGVSKSFDWKDLRSTGGFARPNLWGDILLSGTKACVVTSSGTDLHQANGMTIYPSPASEFLTVVLAGISGKQQMQIFNSIGLLVKVVEFTGSSQIDISGLPNGLYFIYLKNNSLKAQKFIKQ
ncbi:MAG: T9SS type A sorting domain-containing protein [Prolixibacteraceae bacterium]|jgi:parallel beta-helix repeat protein|nr:T9SS type A sorting domain-containing protein [Prolixibacteraceae bacterium]